MTTVADRARLHAAHAADRIAVVGPDASITYAELDSRAAELAALLVSEGIGSGRLVAIQTPRGVGAIVALLGVLRCGAAYTFVERSTQTDEQTRRVLADADAIVVERAGVAGRGELAVEVSPSARAGHAGIGIDTAYVLYTSGSTGVPKGVVIPHANVRHYVESLLARLEIAEPLRYAHVSTLSADLGNTGLFLSLWTGGTLHVIDDMTRRDPIGLLRYLRSAGIDVLKITPSHWSAVLHSLGTRDGDRPSLRYLIVGGELLTPKLARDTLRVGVARVLVNHYGPTETTIGVAAYVIPGLDALNDTPTTSVPIGTPLGRTRLLVAAADGSLHARDATGELYIGGPSVGAGYLGNAADTDAAFTSRGDDRFYRSGDLVRIDGSGVVEFRGRVDRQVKINGFRVELEHLEAVVRGIRGVVDAAVCHMGPQGRKALVAALVLAESTSPAEVRARLAELLPPHMLPKSMVALHGLPRNANGKTDLGALRTVLEEHLAVRAGGGEPLPEDPAVAEVHEVWGRHLGHFDFGVRSSFFDVGGSSLEAIQVIGELQVRGYPVSASSFLADPTVEALALQLTQPPVPSGGETRPPTLVSRRFSPAQRWFFERRFPDPAHWNQAILLEAGAEVAPEHLEGSVHDLVRLHPLLRTSYRVDGGAWLATTVEPPDGCFTESRLSERGDAASRRAVRSAARCLHADVDLGLGRVFRVHLLRVPEGPDLILLVCHHLSVDAVSWRILLDDLVRLYGARVRDLDPGLPHEPISFWDWLARIELHAERLHGQADRWRSQLAGASGGLPSEPIGSNREGDAQTVWVAFSREETESLSRGLPASLGVAPHAALLGAFVHALAELTGVDRMLIDVESHGRVVPGDNVDVSRVVGWFTSTFPVLAQGLQDGVAEAVRGIAARLDAIPEPSIGYEVCAPDLPPLPKSTLAYNYLGRFDLPDDDCLRLRPSRHPIGPARGDANDRVHPLKLTARIVGDQLVVDLSFAAGRYEVESMAGVLGTARRRLLELAGRDPGDERIVVEPGSSTGLLIHVPPSLALDSGGGAKAYRSILLTGATGFIGVHVLRLLLERTSAHVYCLVRDHDGEPAAERLGPAYRWYFGEDRLERHADRLTVVTGDVNVEDFGLPPSMYERLSRHVDAIYHLAGDTRLFGDAADFHRRNVASVQTAIRMASHRKPKELHFASTLAVCGTTPGGEPVTFSEDSLDVGQGFLNDYERSKFAAEHLVHEFNAEGGRGFIYRAGNVAGDSRSGRFRRDAGSSRLVQFLRAVVAVGRVPIDLDEHLVLTPVDLVAEAIVAISLCPTLRRGTFHVDGDRPLALRDLLDTLRGFGYILLPSEAEDFAELFEPYVASGDCDVTLGYFWTQRGMRNVRLEHTRTHRQLERLGVRFAPPGRGWIRRYLWELVVAGELGSRPRSPMREPVPVPDGTGGA